MKGKQHNPASSTNNPDHTGPMLEAIIGLLGRQVFPPEQLKALIMKGKRIPEKYVKAYNLCDAGHGVREIAKEIDVSIGTISPILSDWKDMGIIFEVERLGGKFYKRLYRLEERRGDHSKEEKIDIVPDKASEESSSTIATQEPEPDEI